MKILILTIGVVASVSFEQISGMHDVLKDAGLSSWFTAIDYGIGFATGMLFAKAK